MIPVQHSAVNQSLWIHAGAREAVIIWFASASVQLECSLRVQWHADVVCAQQLSMNHVGLPPRCAMEECHLAAGDMMEDACVLQLELLRCSAGSVGAVRPQLALVWLGRLSVSSSDMAE